MSNKQETLTNTPQLQPAAELGRVFSLIRQELEIETQKSQEQKKIQNDALINHEQMVTDCLARAQSYYSKKEWTHAFAEWDKACSFLAGGDDFRKKIALLKESHENLEKVNRELVEIRGILNQRSVPSTHDRKFVESAHEQIGGRIRSVYAYLSQQLRTECAPQKLSFWWPVLLALIVLGIGFGSLSMIHSRAQTEWGKGNEKTVRDLRVESTGIKTERDESLGRTATLIQDYENRIEELKQQNASWRNAGREKIDEMENRIVELERTNKELNRRVETLMKDNLNFQP